MFTIISRYVSVRNSVLHFFLSDALLFIFILFISRAAYTPRNKFKRTNCFGALLNKSLKFSFVRTKAARRISQSDGYILHCNFFFCFAMANRQFVRERGRSVLVEDLYDYVEKLLTRLAQTGDLPKEDKITFASRLKLLNAV